MQFKVSLSSDQDYVLCRVLAPVDSDLATRFLKEADELAREHGLNKYLTDVRGAKNIQSVHKNYDFAYKEMEAMGLRRSDRRAILVDPTDRSHDFIETVCRNAGYEVRVFTDEDSALTWLRKSE